MDMLFIATMADQLDFGVNWVKDFSVRKASGFMDTFLLY